MSASLVGSEMCIRDRLAIRCRLGAAARPRCGLWLGRVSPSAACCCYSSVSYTHLTLPTICSV
eukprot:9800037-Alexandrium_andersonii.AAC.1